MTDRT